MDTALQYFTSNILNQVTAEARDTDGIRGVRLSLLDSLSFQHIGIGKKIRSSKTMKVLSLAVVLGTLDGLQAKYMTIGNLGEEEAVGYQVLFMLVAVVVSYYCLFNEKWSPARNISNLLVTIPLATLADNISIDVQTLRPYFLLIPKEGYLWRNDVFGQTFLSPLAHWVNTQWLAPGLINGYAAAIGLLMAYLVLQRYWDKARLDSRLPVWKPALDLLLRKR